MVFIFPFICPRVLLCPKPCGSLTSDNGIWRQNDIPLPCWSIYWISGHIGHTKGGTLKIINMWASAQWVFPPQNILRKTLADCNLDTSICPGIGFKHNQIRRSLEMVIPLKDYMLTICLLFKCHMYFPGEDRIEMCRC